MIPTTPLPTASLLTDLKQTLNHLRSSCQTTLDQCQEDHLNDTVKKSKVQTKLQMEVLGLKSELDVKSQLLEDTTRRLNQQEHEIAFNFRREFRHLSDCLGEKESEVLFLNKQLQKLKSKISSLQHELVESKQASQTLEENFMKTVGLIRNQFKELLSVSDELELERSVSEKNLQKTIEKVDSALSFTTDTEKKIAHIQEKYLKLKKQHQEQVQNNIKLEVQVQKLKELLWQEKRLNETFNSKQMAIEEVQFFSKQSQSIRKSKSKTSNFGCRNVQSVQKHSIEQKHEQSPYLQHIGLAVSKMNEQIQILTNVSMRINELNEKADRERETWKEVLAVKEANTSLKEEINHLKEILNPEHQNEILKESHPKIYEFFLKKMNQIQNFEERLEKIEKDSHRMVEMIETILYEGVPEKSNQKQMIERQNAIRSKTRKQMVEQFESDKQSLIKDAQNHYKKQIQTLKDQIADFSAQVQRLKQKNTYLFNLLEEKEKQAQNKVIIEQKPQKIEIQSRHSPCEEKLSTQQVPYQKFPLSSQSDTNRLNFLQQKVQRLQAQLSQSRQRIETYKKQITFILESYRIKNSKLKVARCNECMLRLDLDANEGKKCEKCKLEIHYGECAKAHETTCKKNKETSRNTSNSLSNKPKPNKKVETKPKHQQNGYSQQRLDYFG